MNCEGCLTTATHPRGGSRMLKGRGTALVAIGLAALGACTTTNLVYVSPPQNIRAEVQEGGNCPYTDKEPEQYVAAGDGIRNQLLKPLAMPALPTQLIIEERGTHNIRDALQLVSSHLQAAVNERYQLWRNARACYQKALELDPNISYAAVNLGVIALRMADIATDPNSQEYFLTAAQSELARAMKANRFDGQAVYYMAELQVRRKQYDQAIKILQDLIEKKWEKANVRNLLGYIYEQQGQTAQATQEWQRATQIDDPPQATTWAINRLRPRPPLPPRVEKIDHYFRWNWATQVSDAVTSPPSTTTGYAARGQ